MLTIEKLYTTIKVSAFLTKRKEILSDVSLSISPKSITAIIGANGAGKSTLIKTILGFYKPSSGIIHLSPDISIGFLPENPYYYDHLTLKELLWFSASSFKVNKTLFNNRCSLLCKKVGMEEHLNTRLRKFSKGMTQRAGIAAALIHDPDFIILDEPMSGLDPHGRAMVFDLMSELQSEGKTILFCSHILTDVERLCDQVIMIDRGKILKTLSKNEFQNDTTLHEKSSYLEQLFRDLTTHKGEQPCGR